LGGTGRRRALSSGSKFGRAGGAPRVGLFHCWEAPSSRRSCVCSRLALHLWRLVRPCAGSASDREARSRDLICGCAHPSRPGSEGGRVVPKACNSA
jgi:hypothetical protein